MISTIARVQDQPKAEGCFKPVMIVVAGVIVAAAIAYVFYLLAEMIKTIKP